FFLTMRLVVFSCVGLLLLIAVDLSLAQWSRFQQAQCGENFVHVEVKKDFFGIGQLVNPLFLTLGGCAAVGENPEAEVIVFEYELQTCGSSLVMTDIELVYKFNLLYTPAALVGTPIVRADVAVVGIECHYSRLYNVSSNILLPAWVPFAATKAHDWMFERPSNQYFLGQFLKLEASVKQYNHVPLRIFVDGCVATAAPGVNTTSPRYSFIELRASGLLGTMSIGSQITLSLGLYNVGAVMKIEILPCFSNAMQTI
uniref:Zona pellucida sperm-binding protein 3 n=1 Tax=Sinocyclocheilus grahami TaxID=75366 RepID=A0A672LM80_SINGR